LAVLVGSVANLSATGLLANDNTDQSAVTTPADKIIAALNRLGALLVVAGNAEKSTSSPTPTVRSL